MTMILKRSMRKSELGFVKRGTQNSVEKQTRSRDCQPLPLNRVCVKNTTAEGKTRKGEEHGKRRGGLCIYRSKSRIIYSFVFICKIF